MGEGEEGVREVVFGWIEMELGQLVNTMDVF